MTLKGVQTSELLVLDLKVTLDQKIWCESFLTKNEHVDKSAETQNFNLCEMDVC